MKLTKDEFKLAKQEFDQEGYIVFEELISADEVANYIAALEPYLSKDVKGRNNFEGHKTNRVYGLLDKSPVFGEMVEHPLVMQFVRDELGESALLSALLAINLMPGETVQPWHTDDGYVHVEMPHPSFGISAFWALTDTNKYNGATEVLPLAAVEHLRPHHPGQDRTPARQVHRDLRRALHGHLRGADSGGGNRDDAPVGGSRPVGPRAAAGPA